MSPYDHVKQYITTDLLPYIDDTADIKQINFLTYGLDSLKIMTFINFLERTFSIVISDDVLPVNFSTMDDILNLIKTSTSLSP
jgi:acyl carrier protein